MMLSKKFIPSLFTILNAICGFMSVINSSKENYDIAIYFIFYAAIFDVLDGLVARLLHTSSDFGVELDSLSDVVSFGFAPAYLLYSIFFKDYSAVGIVVSSMVLAFSAIRLARFNINLSGYTKDIFYGIPTPMSALILCSYILFYHNKFFSPLVSEKVIFVLTISTSLLMVSNFKMPAMPSFNKKSFKEKPFLFGSIIISLLLVFFTKGYAIFPISIIYVLTGIILTYLPVKKRKSNKQLS